MLTLTAFRVNPRLASANMQIIPIIATCAWETFDSPPIFIAIPDLASVTPPSSLPRKTIFSSLFARSTSAQTLVSTHPIPFILHTTLSANTNFMQLLDATRRLLILHLQKYWLFYNCCYNTYISTYILCTVLISSTF